MTADAGRWPNGPWTDPEHGGPWTRHGHPIPGRTVVGERTPPRVARCGGIRLCRTCQADGGTAADLTGKITTSKIGDGDLTTAPPGRTLFEVLTEAAARANLRGSTPTRPEDTP